MADEKKIDWVQETYESFIKNAEGLDPTDPVAVGDALIVIVNGKGGKPVACIEIRRAGWKVRQCYAPGNEAPPAGMQRLAERLAALFRREHKANIKAKRFAALERKTA